MQGARAPQPGATNRPSPLGRIKVPSAPTVLKTLTSSSAVRPPGRPGAPPALSSPRRNAPRGPAATAAGAHPDPYRTRKLSRPAPMVLQGRPCGRVGRRRPPGRVARGKGRGGAEEAPGRGGPERAPSFVRGVSRSPSSPPCDEAAGPLGGQAAFSRSGPPGSHPLCRLAVQATSPAAF